MSNLSAFLTTIAACEGADYQTLYGGGKFTSYADHPRQKVTAGGYTSTAAGRYQILAGTWDDFVRAVGARDFSPASQDECAAWLVTRRGAMPDVVAGKLEQAIAHCNREWASLPGSPYGQPTRTLQYCLEHYLTAGGRLYAGPEQPAAPIEDRSTKAPMDPLTLIGIFGPMLANLIPQIATLFKRGPIAERNVQAAQAVLDTVVKASGQPNVQAAVEAMQADEGLRKQVQQAVVTEPAVMALLEVGGGIQEARKANVEQSQVPLWRDRAFIVSCILLTLVGFVIVSVVTKFSIFVEWTNDNRTMVLQSILISLGAVTGYFLGSSAGSAKKDDQAAAIAARSNT